MVRGGIQEIGVDMVSWNPQAWADARWAVGAFDVVEDQQYLAVGRCQHETTATLP